MSQLHYAKVRISAPHIPDHLEFFFGMLVRGSVWATRLAAQGLHTAVSASFPKVDIRTSLVVFAAGSAHAVFLCIFH